MSKLITTSILAPELKVRSWIIEIHQDISFKQILQDGKDDKALW